MQGNLLQVAMPPVPRSADITLEIPCHGCQRLICSFDRRGSSWHAWQTPGLLLFTSLHALPLLPLRSTGCTLDPCSGTQSSSSLKPHKAPHHPVLHMLSNFGIEVSTLLGCQFLSEGHSCFLLLAYSARSPSPLLCPWKCCRKPSSLRPFCSS